MCVCVCTYLFDSLAAGLVDIVFVRVLCVCLRVWLCVCLSVCLRAWLLQCLLVGSFLFVCLGVFGWFFIVMRMC